jgi:hypothetical protein
MTARPRPNRRLELAILVAGFLLIVASLAAVDLRLAGALLGIGLILSAVDFARLPGGRRR